MTARQARAFWARLNRLPANEKQGKVLGHNGLTTDVKSGHPTRTDDLGSERPRCRRHGATKPPRILAGRSAGGRDFATAYRDVMIRQGMIRPTVIKAVRVPDAAAMQQQGTLTLVRG